MGTALLMPYMALISLQQLSIQQKSACQLTSCMPCLQHLMKRIQRGPVRGISLKLQVGLQDAMSGNTPALCGLVLHGVLVHPSL